ncbi:SAM-dependent methyltransferase [Actinomadura algeriensis]|uniref:SAM-dependent methyltransferase n=1 Tax=Actinomadura algeriensis TaxID=1679523 RepID=A0ABR9JMF0_9ACTN|nr:SAM-dependent methyltransferase [Actinomadura algeriensis]MBE1531743.1 SAM-dependent methyltransferase [Actinomadura algeriensis]
MKESERIDVRRPNVARMYDCYLGGKDNYAADREAAEKVIAATPQTPAIAQANRGFLRRAVRYMAADAGIDQFIDIGCGLPTQGNVHQVAQDVRGDARVAYADNDPVVLAHARALLADDQNSIAVEGDLARPGELLADSRLRTLIDLDRPVGLLLISVAHCISDDAVLADAMATLRAALAPGSHVALSHINLPSSEKRSVALQGNRVYADMHVNTVMTFRDRDRLTGLLDGLDVLEPGLVDLPDWRPELDAPHPAPIPLPGRHDDARGFYLCGVARKGDVR